MRCRYATAWRAWRGAARHALSFGDTIFRGLFISRSCPARPDVGVQDLVRRGEAEGAPREATEPHPLASCVHADRRMLAHGHACASVLATPSKPSLRARSAGGRGSQRFVRDAGALAAAGSRIHARWQGTFDGSMRGRAAMNALARRCKTLRLPIDGHASIRDTYSCRTDKRHVRCNNTGAYATQSPLPSSAPGQCQLRSCRVSQTARYPPSAARRPPAGLAQALRPARPRQIRRRRLFRARHRDAHAAAHQPRAHPSAACTGACVGRHRAVEARLCRRVRHRSWPPWERGRAAWRFEARASRAAGDGATSKGRQAEPLTDRSPLRLRCA